MTEEEATKAVSDIAEKARMSARDDHDYINMILIDLVVLLTNHGNKDTK